MRSPLFFLLILALAPKYMTGQAAFTFPTDSATWSVQEYLYGTFPEQDQCITRHYGLSGDTVIQGSTYSKLYGNNLPQAFPFEDTAFHRPTAVFVAAIREDSTKKVWIRRPADTLDVLYYDFALTIGDTFCFDFFGTGCFPVVNVDSILIDGNYRRQIHFVPFNTETWIAGIGSTTGWFEWQYTGSWSWELLCFSQGQQQRYGDGPCHCDTFTGMDSPAAQAPPAVYPNPVASTVHIRLPHKAKGPCHIQVVSISGKTKYDFTTSEELFDLSMDGWSNGMYVITITDQRAERWSHKIVKYAP